MNIGEEPIGNLNKELMTDLAKTLEVFLNGQSGSKYRFLLLVAEVGNQREDGGTPTKFITNMNGSDALGVLDELLTYMRAAKENKGHFQ